MIKQVDKAKTRCETCGRFIETCVGCAEAACRHPTCGVCLRVAVGEEMHHPHAHGG